MRATQRPRKGVFYSEGDNTMEDDAILDEIHRGHEESMPKATKAAYRTPQKEYRQWCLAKAVLKDGKKPLEEVEEGRRALEEVERLELHFYIYLLCYGYDHVSHSFSQPEPWLQVNVWLCSSRSVWLVGHIRRGVL